MLRQKLRTSVHPNLLGKYVWRCDLCKMEVVGFLTIKEVDNDLARHYERVHSEET